MNVLRYCIIERVQMIRNDTRKLTVAVGSD